MARITAREVAALRPSDQTVRIEVESGLQLRIATDGTKTWVVRYCVDGRQRDYRLPKAYGVASDAGHLSLADARIETARIRALARQGIDVREQAEEARAADQILFEQKERAAAAQIALQLSDNLTVKNLFDAWIADGVRRQDGNTELKRSFHADVLPRLANIPVKKLTEHELRATLRAIVERGANRGAVIASNNLKQMFRWAEKRQPWRKLLADGNPMELIEIAKIVDPEFDLDYQRDRILSAGEICELDTIFKRMNQEYSGRADKRYGPEPINATTQIAIWIMLSTLCRVGEMSMARWEHVDFNSRTWTIPKNNVKKKLATLVVFMSTFSTEQFLKLREITGHSAWCFPGRIDDVHLDGKSISKQIGDRQTVFKRSNDGGPRKPMKKRRQDNSLVLGGGKSGAWTPHDLRRTGATMMQGLGVPLDIIDRCQNHVLQGSKVRRHYFHYDYAKEKREAWQLLGDRIAKILDEPAQT